MAKRAEKYIDERRWPHLVSSPHAFMMSRRAQDVTQRLHQLLTRNGIAIDSQSDPHMLIRDGQVIDRIVADGWLGLAEGYMAGEWDAARLPEVLSVLLEQPFEAAVGRFVAGNSRRSSGRFGQPVPGELPQALVELYAGSTRATGSALFASASRTTSQERVEIRTKGARSVQMSVEQTWFGSPVDVDKEDLDTAQRRRVEMMLDQAAVGPGDRVLELPASGGQLAIQAAERGAHVDCLTTDDAHAEAVMARARSAGLSGAIHVEVIDSHIPGPRQWSGRYEAVFSVERMETFGGDRMMHFLRAVDRLLAQDGVAVVQSLVSTPSMRPTAAQALDVMRAYVWPGVEYPTVEDVRASVVKHTDLAIRAENYMGEHMATTLGLWREHFVSRDRQAAAAGFDHVFRRLWDYQLALHQALFQAGDVECLQFVLVPRS